MKQRPSLCLQDCWSARFLSFCSYPLLLICWFTLLWGTAWPAALPASTDLNSIPLSKSWHTIPPVRSSPSASPHLEQGVYGAHSAQHQLTLQLTHICEVGGSETWTWVPICPWGASLSSRVLVLLVLSYYTSIFYFPQQPMLQSSTPSLDAKAAALLKLFNCIPQLQKVKSL